MTKRPFQKSGMTLAEILIAVTIVSILGTLGVVTYVRVYEKTRGNQAIAVLRMIRAAERAYYLDWNTYTTLPSGGCGSNLVTGGYIPCPNEGTPQTRGFNYSATVGGVGNSYTATAVRTGGGRFGGDGITLGVTCCPDNPTWGRIGSWPLEWLPN